jgi:hypothetical protein
MVEWARVILEQSPLLALFAVIGLGYALGQISIGGFSLGVGRPRDWRPRPGIRAAGPGELHRSGHVPLRRGHSVWPGLLRGLTRPRPDLEPARGGRCLRVAGGGAGAGPGARRRLGACDGGVCRGTDQHACAASGHRCCGKPRSSDRLLGGLSPRRSRPHLVPLRLCAAVSATGGRRSINSATVTLSRPSSVISIGCGGAGAGATRG